jgi:hypothetical protein
LWADAALKKEGYMKIAKSSQQACKLLFSCGGMVDKSARSINFEKKWRASQKRKVYSLVSKFSASNIVSTAILNFIRNYFMTIGRLSAVFGSWQSKEKMGTEKLF